MRSGISVSFLAPVSDAPAWLDKNARVTVWNDEVWVEPTKEGEPRYTVKLPLEELIKALKFQSIIS